MKYPATFNLKRMSLSLVLTALLSVAEAQIKLESLTKNLKHDFRDTAIVNRLLEQASKFEISDRIMSKKFTNSAFDISKEINYIDGQANSYIEFGSLCDDSDENKLAISNYNEALATLEKIIDIRTRKFLSVTALNGLGIIYKKDPQSMVIALSYFIKAAKIAEEIDDFQGIAVANSNIGRIEKIQGHYNEALKAYYSLFKYARKANKWSDSLLLSSAYHNLGQAYLDSNHLDSGLKYMRFTIDMKEKIRDSVRLPTSYLDLSNIYIGLKKLDDAKIAASKALSISIKKKDTLNLGRSYLQSAAIADAAKRNDEVVRYLLLATPIFKLHKMPDETESAYLDLSGAYEKLGDYPNSLKYLKLYTDIHNKNYSIQRDKQIDDITGKYNLATKDKENLALKLANQTQRSEMLWVGATVLAILIALYLYRVWRNKQIQLLQKTELRQNIFQNLHDTIGAGLTKISAICEIEQRAIKKGAPERRTAVLDNILSESYELSQALKIIAWNLNPENDNLQELVATTRSFAADYLNETGFDYQINFPTEVPAITTNPNFNRNLFMMVKEALNNSVKYSKANLITLNFRLEKKKNYTLQIEDNGIGFDLNTVPAKSNGINILKARASEIGALFKLISLENKGTVITIEGIIA